MSRTLFFFTVLLGLMINSCAAQTPSVSPLSGGKYNTLRQAPIQGVVPANKARLEVALDRVVISISCPIDCPYGGKWTNFSLEEGNYYLDMTTCGCGQAGEYKQVRICTDGYDCYQVQIEGGHRYKISYSRGKGVLLQRLTKD